MTRQNDPPAQRLAIFHPEFREDLRYWVETDRRTALCILTLVEDVIRDPFSGLGKPLPLKYLGAGIWSCRITQEQPLPRRVFPHRRN